MINYKLNLRNERKCGMKMSTYFKCKNMGRIVVFIIMFHLFAGNNPCRAQENSTVDFNAFMQETQKIDQALDKMTFIWWIPNEYWQISCAQDPTISEDLIEEYIQMFSPYTFIAVADGDIGIFGGVTYRNEAAIRDSIRIKDSLGNLYGPLHEDEIDVNTSSFLEMLKPVFKNLIGYLGENINFFLFPAQNNNGRNICDARKDKGFSVLLGEREYQWKLPLKTLLPPTLCSRCGEKCSNTWNYCPWCGKNLTGK